MNGSLRRLALELLREANKLVGSSTQIAVDFRDLRPLEYNISASSFSAFRSEAQSTRQCKTYFKKTSRAWVAPKFALADSGSRDRQRLRPY